MSSAYSDAGRPGGRSALCALVLCCVVLGAAQRAGAAEPPRFKVPSEGDGPLVLVVSGDTRFTQRSHVVNAIARRALVERITTERPAAILIGGDLVYEGSDPGDYRTFRSETMAWSTA
ncbi:MAG: hypothetical protein ACTHL7_03355, partial [Steroidobacteraceae bacterium]